MSTNIADRNTSSSAPPSPYFSSKRHRAVPRVTGVQRTTHRREYKAEELAGRLTRASHSSALGRGSRSGVLAPVVAHLLHYRDDHQRPSSGNTATSSTSKRPVPFCLPYSEDISPMKEEEVADMRWVGFITVADQRGGHYRPRSSSPTAYGGFSDIWQCDALFFGDLNAVVAVKKLRAVKLPQGLDKSQTSKRLLKRLKRELKIWMRVQHPNIAPLLGFTFDEEIAIISPWFGHGNLSDYLTEHPEANRMSLIQGVAAGLAYLHSSIPLIIHGDIKPDNVLIDQLERPRITDFGLSKIVEEEPSLTSLRSASLRDAGNTRWIAPELLLEEGVSRSKRTDIFSFGCVVFFIFTGDVPFKSIADGQLVISRYKGASPIQDDIRYPDLDSNTTLMGIMRSCWDRDPQRRPDIGDIVSSLTNQPNPNRLGPVEMLKPPSAVSAILNSAKLRSKQVAPKKLWKSMQTFWGRIFRSR